jgi:hypothetical protein
MTGTGLTKDGLIQGMHASATPKLKTAYSPRGSPSMRSPPPSPTGSPPPSATGSPPPSATAATSMRVGGVVKPSLNPNLRCETRCSYTSQDNPHKSPKKASSYLSAQHSIACQADRSHQNRQSSPRQNLQHRCRKSLNPQTRIHPGWTSPRRRATACGPDAAPIPAHAAPIPEPHCQSSHGRIPSP